MNPESRIDEADEISRQLGIDLDAYRHVAIECFNELAQKSFFGNFGQINKADLTLILFDAYYNKLGIGAKQTDFETGIKLGLEPSRVRSLQTKCAFARRPTGKGVDDDWLSSFSEVLTSGCCHYNPGSEKLDLRFRSRFDALAFEGELDKRRLYLEYRLSGNVVSVDLSTCYALLLFDTLGLAESKRTGDQTIEETRKFARTISKTTKSAEIEPDVKSALSIIIGLDAEHNLTLDGIKQKIAGAIGKLVANRAPETISAGFELINNALEKIKDGEDASIMAIKQLTAAVKSERKD